jgi:Uma2 family endonuclease
MSTTIEPRPRVEAPPPGDQCVELSGLDWKGYLTLLRLRGERPRPKIVYLDGTAWLVTPAYPHETDKKRLGQFVAEIVAGLGIACIPAGATTLRRRKKRGGVEADESFYLEHVPQIRAKARGENIDLRRDPPPDLVVEVVWTHPADASIAVYRRLGVPEVWAFDAPVLHILVLGPNGRYAESATSRAFPFLSAAEIAGWITRPVEGSETDWMLDLRAWVRDVLVPRVRTPEGRTP